MSAPAPAPATPPSQDLCLKPAGSGFGRLCILRPGHAGACRPLRFKMVQVTR